MIHVDFRRQEFARLRRFVLLKLGSNKQLGVTRPSPGNASHHAARARHGGDAASASCGHCRPRARRRSEGSRPERARQRPWHWASSRAQRGRCEAEAWQGPSVGNARALSAWPRKGSRSKAEGRWRTGRATAWHAPLAHAGRRCPSWATATRRARSGRTERRTSRRSSSRAGWRSRTEARSRRGEGAAYAWRARGPGHRGGPRGPRSSARAVSPRARSQTPRSASACPAERHPRHLRAQTSGSPKAFGGEIVYHGKQGFTTTGEVDAASCTEASCGQEVLDGFVTCLEAKEHAAVTHAGLRGVRRAGRRSRRSRAEARGA